VEIESNFGVLVEAVVIGLPVEVEMDVFNVLVEAVVIGLPGEVEMDVFNVLVVIEANLLEL